MWELSQLPRAQDSHSGSQRSKVAPWEAGIGIMVWAYWKRVIAEAGKRGARIATGGPWPAFKAASGVFFTLVLLYLAGSAQFGSRFNAAAIGLVVLALTFALLFALGVVLIPPELAGC